MRQVWSTGGTAAVDAGVADQDVEAFEALLGFFHQRPDGSFVADVGCDKVPTDARGMRSAPFAIDVGNHHHRPFGSKPGGDRLTDAVRRAGYDRNAVSKPLAHRVLVCGVTEG